MKKSNIFIAVLWGALLSGCFSEVPIPVSNKPLVSDTNTITVSSGNFKNRGHIMSGKAFILVKDSFLTLSIENFSTESVPDLRVYLGTAQDESDYVELGKLISISGSFTYPVSKSVDLNKYKYVVIWCKTYSVLIGVAELK